MSTYTGVKGPLSGRYDLSTEGECLMPSKRSHHPWRHPLVGVTVDVNANSVAVVDDDGGVSERFEVGLVSGD